VNKKRNFWAAAAALWFHAGADAVLGWRWCWAGAGL